MQQSKVAPGLGYPCVGPKIDSLPVDLDRSPVGWQTPPVSRETKTHEENPA